MRANKKACVLFWMATAMFWAVCGVRAADYDPFRIERNVEIRGEDFTVHDAARQRDLPIRVYLPPGDAATRLAPVVVFSHGLGGNREGSAFLGKHWAGRGYAAVFLQHPGSDDSVWKEQPLARRMAALQEAASLKNYLLRVQDVPAVLDQLAKWSDDAGHALAGRLDVRRVGMSGHSFGGQTTQALGGQSFDIGGSRFADARVHAALVMSPSVPQRAGSAERAFGGVKRPWLLMTGTHDGGVIGDQTPESRRKVFPALPAGAKYELVLDKAEHSAFTERALPGEKQPRNPNHHRAILAISTAFWDAYLRDMPEAKRWLDGEGPRGVLEKADLWTRK